MPRIQVNRLPGDPRGDTFNLTPGVRALLTPEEERVWRRARAILVAQASPNNVCRCGMTKRILDDGWSATSVCPRLKWWNFWRHDSPQEVVP